MSTHRKNRSPLPVGAKPGGVPVSLDRFPVGVELLSSASRASTSGLRDRVPIPRGVAAVLALVASVAGCSSPSGGELGSAVLFMLCVGLTALQGGLLLWQGVRSGMGHAARGPFASRDGGPTEMSVMLGVASGMVHWMGVVPIVLGGARPDIVFPGGALWLFPTAAHLGVLLLASSPSRNHARASRWRALRWTLYVGLALSPLLYRLTGGEAVQRPREDAPASRLAAPAHRQEA